MEKDKFDVFFDLGTNVAVGSLFKIDVHVDRVTTHNGCRHRSVSLGPVRQHGVSHFWLSVFVNPQLALLQQQTDQRIM